MTFFEKFFKILGICFSRKEMFSMFGIWFFMDTSEDTNF